MTKRFLNRPEMLPILLSLLGWSWMGWDIIERRQWSCCHPGATSLDEARGWILMVLAMMVPFTFPTLRVIVRRSYKSYRWVAVLGYLSGYVAAWSIPLVIVLPLRASLLGSNMILASILCLAAAIWTLHPLRELVFRKCHREIPLCPVGWKAFQDVWHQGWIHAVACMGGCILLMISCTITHHHLVMMIGGTLLAYVEHRMYRFNRMSLTLGSLGLAAWALMVA